MRSSRRTPNSWCAISRPRKRSVILALSPSCEEPDQVPQLDLVIAFVSARPELHFLDLDLLQLELGFVLLLRFPVLELAVIHDPANRRLGRRRDLDQIEFRRLGSCPCVREGNNSELLTFFTDQADFGSGDFRVDPLMLVESYCVFSNDDKKRPCPGMRADADFDNRNQGVIDAPRPPCGGAPARHPRALPRDPRRRGYARPPFRLAAPCRPR